MPARFDQPTSHLRLVKRAESEDDSAVSASFGHVSLERGESAAPTEPPSSGPQSSEDLSDAHWVALAKADDRRAFETLYRRHASYAIALAVRVQGHAGDVEDIVHDAFLRAFDRLDSLRSGDAFRSWLSSVVVSLVKTRLRRRRFLGALGMSGAEPIDLDALSSADAGPEMRAQVAQLYDVLRRLPVDQRIAWTLRYVEGHKLEDVARLAGCSLATAKRWIAGAQREVLLADWQHADTQGTGDEP